ncbi:MAG: hypothetical protein EBY22_04900, partial [Gammaproteobacteria bacterium]|nr:hypothetical protein [Gammaproteobacteria bacterium]
DKKPVIRYISSMLQISKRDMQHDLFEYYNTSKSLQGKDSKSWFLTYWRLIDSWAIGAIIVNIIHNLLLWPQFNIRDINPKLLVLLKRLCAVSPTVRVDCVQALHYLDPHHFIIRKYSQDWLRKLGTGNITEL